MSYVIKTKADYDAAMEDISNREFMIDMSDDYRVWREGMDYIDKLRRDVKKQASDMGLI